MDKERFLNHINTVCVVGAGISGVAAARLAHKFGKKVKLTDKSCHISKEPKEELEKIGVQLELGRHTKEFLKDVDLVVLSPGVSPEDFSAGYIGKRQIPCVGEIEFSFWFCKSKHVVGITGTNGKTTVTFLTGQILKRYTGKNVYTVGNIGLPFSQVVEEVKSQDIVVIELSSFQLETIVTFCPEVACFINFSPDHLDRYNSLKEYLDAKKRLFFNQDESCYALFPSSLKEEFELVRAKKISINNSSNFLVVRDIVNIYGVEERSVDEFFEGFTGLPHRLEKVADIGCVKFINDSKSTTVASTIYAIKMLNSPLIIIAGGKDKGLDYSLIKEYRKHIKKMILIGQATQKIADSLAGFIDIVQEPSLDKAVLSAYKIAAPGDTVLLSPMCASFDMFKDYKERGNVFKESVYKLRS